MGREASATVLNGRRSLSTALISPEVLDTLRERRALTILRGPHGYGKTSAIELWLREIDDGSQIAYLTLTEETETIEGFWQFLAAGLRGAGIQVRDDKDVRWAVMSTLLEWGEPIVLVLDDFHEAGLEEGAAVIDEDLVDIVRQNDRIDLVVGTRTYRLLETSGLLSVDGVVLGPDDLRMSGSQVFALAQQLGIGLTEDDADQIAIDTGGWPSAIRAGLVRGTSVSARYDPALADEYIVDWVGELRYPSVRAFLLRTAVPEQFTTDMAALIAPARAPLTPLSPVRILRNIRAAGLLIERDTVEGTMYSYAPAVRAALQRLGRELEPAMMREVHLTLMQLAASDQDPGRVLKHAVEAGEFETALEVIEREWGALLARAPLSLADAARRFPPQMAASNPRLRIALRELSGSPAGYERYSWTVDAGRTVTAEISAHLGVSTNDNLDESLALMHWGITCLLVGNLDAATYAFNRARTLGLGGGGPDGTVELAAIGLALSHAFEGEPELALRWLDDPGVRLRLQRVTEIDGRDIAVVAAHLARALALTDAAAPGAAQAVGALTELGHRDDLWAATVFARAHYAVLIGDPMHVSRIAGEVRAAMRHVARGSLIETVLAGTLVELLLADSATEVAAQVAARFTGSAISWAASAKLYLAAREYDEAIAQASRAIETPLRAWRTTIECQVVLANAYHATGQEQEAIQAFRHATRMAQGTGERRPFRFMPRYLFEQLADDDPHLLALWPGVDGGGPPVASPTAVSELPSLTARETQILRGLEVHAGPVGIGQELGLSVNTVKTHLRAIYRKLGVSNRADALRAIGAGRPR